MAVVAVIGVRVLGLRSVSICSRTENSKCQEFSLKIQEKDLRMNSLIKRNYTCQFECTVNQKVQWISEEMFCSWTPDCEDVKCRETQKEDMDSDVHWLLSESPSSSWNVGVGNEHSNEWAVLDDCTADLLPPLENRSWSFVILHALFLRVCNPKIT